MSTNLRLVRTRRAPAPNPGREAELKHIAGALKWLRLRIRIAERDALKLEARQEALEAEIEQEWKESWGC